jgi:hypothetical protein
MLALLITNLKDLRFKMRKSRKEYFKNIDKDDKEKD